MARSTTTTSCRRLASARRATTRSPRGAPTPSRSPTTGSAAGSGSRATKRRSSGSASRTSSSTRASTSRRATVPRGSRGTGSKRQAGCQRRRAARSRCFERGSSSAAVPLAEPARTEPVFCQGWRDGKMNELQAPFWLFGAGHYVLHVTATVPTVVEISVESHLFDRRLVDGSVHAQLPARGRDASLASGRRRGLASRPRARLHRLTRGRRAPAAEGARMGHPAPGPSAVTRHPRWSAFPG